MTLEDWLFTATRGLAPASIEQVRREIQDHAQSALEHGEDPVACLGDPKAANRAYRKTLLTDREERYLLSSTPPQASASLFWFGRAAVALFFIDMVVRWVKLGQGPSTYFWIVILLLRGLHDWPVPAKYVPRLNWIRRALLALALTPLPWMGLLPKIGAAIGLLFWIGLEWRNATIRRKLPRAQWPLKIQI